jgi:hypothetical protein
VVLVVLEQSIIELRRLGLAVSSIKLNKMRCVLFGQVLSPLDFLQVIDWSLVDLFLGRFMVVLPQINKTAVTRLVEHHLLVDFAHFSLLTEL